MAERLNTPSWLGFPSHWTEPDPDAKVPVWPPLQLTSKAPPQRPPYVDRSLALLAAKPKKRPRTSKDVGKPKLVASLDLLEERFATFTEEEQLNKMNYDMLLLKEMCQRQHEQDDATSSHLDILISEELERDPARCARFLATMGDAAQANIKRLRIALGN